MFLLIFAALASADPSPGDVLRGGTYVPVDEPDGEVTLGIDLVRVVGRPCDRGAVAASNCVVPKLSVYNAGSQMLTIDAEGLTGSWSADGSMRSLFPAEHSFSLDDGWAPILVPPGQRWSSALVRQNPFLSLSPLSQEEQRAARSIVEPGNELTIVVPAELDGEPSWPTARFRLEYTDVSESSAVLQDPRYLELRKQRTPFRAGWIVAASLAGASLYLAAQSDDADLPVAPFLVSTGVFLGAGSYLFVRDRQISGQMRELEAGDAASGEQ